ncbi:hypothetical protein N8I77_002169 [Diaporthe amygdali]|uniref:Major facilitator superfamily (MFS) profile domain-containing protein n=1 Tax=Phomopsis amygdali TaxID=1214568 RepID=A0AAD9SQE7_PHOAM|nr:hypothetical protein N8I77_002169 [Diaporthe amygdali]
MPAVQKLSPARSHSSASRSVFDDGDSATSVTTYKMHRQERQKPNKRQRSTRFVVAVLALLVFITQFGASLSDVPSVRLLQEIICRKSYGLAPDSLVAEEKCRVDSVQSQLNVLSTGGLIFGYLPGILVALPYGTLADRRGRKPILGLCILGMVLSQLLWIAAAWNHARWDLRTVWLSCLPLLIGGGETVAEAMVFAIVADVAPEEKRATYFQLEICAVLLAEAIAPFVASAMMTYSIWAPILASPAIMSLGGLCICLIPETLDTKQIVFDNTRRKVTPCITTTSVHPDRFYTTAPEAVVTTSMWSQFRASISSTIRMLKARDILALIPSASLTIPAATVTIGIMLRYIPIRFGWTLEQTGMVLGVRTGLNILVLLIFLPLLSNALLSRQDDKDRDMVLARISAILLVAGQAVFACAPNVATACAGLVVLTLGTGLPSLCRAVLTRLVDRDSLGRLFGVLAVCEMAGYLCCGVGFGAVFHAGLGRGLGDDGKPRSVGWLALVFYVATVVYVVCASLLWLVRKGFRRDDCDAESLHSAASTASSLHEVRVLADGRVMRKHPSLDSVAVAI